MIFHQLEVRIVDGATSQDVDRSELSLRLLPRSGDRASAAEATATPEGTPLGWDDELDVFFADRLDQGEYMLEVLRGNQRIMKMRVELSNAPQKQILRLPRPPEEAALEAAVTETTRPIILGVLPARNMKEVPTVTPAPGLRLMERKPFADQRFILLSGDLPTTGMPPEPEALTREGSRLLGGLGDLDWVREAGVFVGRPDEPGSILTRRMYLEAVPGTSRETLDLVAARHGLTLVERLPVAEELYVAVANSEAADVRTLVHELLRETAIISAEPVTIDELEAHTDLFDPTWDRTLIRANETRTSVPIPASTPIVAVFDVANAPETLLRGHPEFFDRTRRHGSRVLQSRDFERPPQPNAAESSDLPAGAHGLMCSAIVAGACCGIAPTSQVMLFSDPEDNPLHVQVWLWAAGLEDVCTPYDFLQRLDRGADIFTASISRPKGLSRFAATMLRRLTLEGRAGKGCLLFFSAGNSGSDILQSGAYGTSPFSLSIAASTCLDNGDETFATYSGFGDVDLCAPSGAQYSTDEEGGRFDRVLGAQYLHWGCYPFRTLVRTHTTGCAPAGTGVLWVADSSGFSPRRRLAVLAPDGGWSLAEIHELPRHRRKRVSLDRDLARDLPPGSAVLSSSRWLGSLTEDTSPSSHCLTLDRTVNLQKGQSIVVAGPEGDDPWRYTVETVRDHEIVVTETLRDHPATSLVILDESHYDLATGTSTSTPACAGVAALVLQANPRLTWVEVRHILRTTAKKIDPHCKDEIGRWLGRSGKPDACNRYYSRRYGFGRIDAAAAVEMAHDFDRKRDLWIRRTPGDDGAQCLAVAGDSPDLWVRSQDPRRMAPREREDTGLHEPVRPCRDHWVFARVSNRGTEPSLEAWVRIYLAPGQLLPYRFPDDFEPHCATSRSRAERSPRAIFLGEVVVQDVPAGGCLTVSVWWPASLRPPTVDDDKRPWNLHLLVAISPLDGPLEGLTVLDCNNLAQRAITVEQA